MTGIISDHDESAIVPVYIPYSLRVLPEWSPHWCVTPGCQHMPAMGHEFCCCCEDDGGAP